MIDKILTNYTALLDEYLMRKHHRPEGMASTGHIGGSTGVVPNKIVMSLLNIERETTVGTPSHVSVNSGGKYTVQQIPLMLNINVVIAAVYEEGRYEESLEVLSDALMFLQTFPYFEYGGRKYTIEFVNCTMQDFNNVWTLFGGHCFPSIICKIRNLLIDGREIKGSGKTADKPIVNLNRQ